MFFFIAAIHFSAVCTESGKPGQSKSPLISSSMLVRLAADAEVLVISPVVHCTFVSPFCFMSKGLIFL